MVLKAKMVLTNNPGCNGWTREMSLPIPPFPGLGIRIDAYDMLNVERVVIGEHGSDITCFVSPERGEAISVKACQAFGFRAAPDEAQHADFPQNVRYIERMRERAERAENGALRASFLFANDDGFWLKTLEVPFPPFVGMELQLDETRTLSIWSMVVGDFHYDITCLAQNKGSPISSAECEALGFEEAIYP